MEFNSSAITGKTKVYCVIGDPVAHSMSPVIQNAAFRSARIDATFVPFRVSKRELKEAIGGLRAIGVAGFNVMTPHKIEIIKHLNKLDSTALKISAINTVANKNGVLMGFNTDGLGAVRALEEAGAPLNEDIVLFGAGGASRAITYTLAHHAKSIKLINRTISKAKLLQQRLGKMSRAHVSHHALVRRNIKALVEDADVIINASSMGMNGRADIPIEEDWLSSDQWVMDIVYKPVQTRLLMLAERAGARTINGLDMLVGQGACSFELWTGQAGPVAEMRRALAQESLALAHAKDS